MPTYYLPIILLLVLAVISNRRKLATVQQIVKRRNSEERSKMIELAKRFIEKDCVIYTFDGNQYIGTLKEVTEGTILMEKRGATEAINLNFVVKIKEIVKCKK